MVKTLGLAPFSTDFVAELMNQQQQHVIEGLHEENRVLRSQLGSRCLHKGQAPLTSAIGW
jgi:hypothetical protein